MSAVPQAYGPVTPEQAALNRQILEEALREHAAEGRAFRRRPRQLRPAADPLLNGPGARPVARRLIRAYTAGDFATAHVMLCRHRSGAEWRLLAEALAEIAADPGKLSPAPVRKSEMLPFDEAKDEAA